MQKFSQRIFKISRWLHKWLGLAGLIYFIWMALSGILVNHPDWITHLSVPASWVGQKNPYKNWNRSTLRNMIFSAERPLQGFAYGHAGIWQTIDGGKTFSPFMEGLPDSVVYRDIHCLHWDENLSRLFAGTGAGLFTRNSRTSAWKECNLDGKREPIKAILAFGDNLMAMSDSRFYLAKNAPPFRFEEIKITFPDIQKHNESDLATLILSLHSGSILGLPGRLLMDLAGLVLLFLSVSAIYIWYFPGHARRSVKRKKRIFWKKIKAAWHTLFYKYHKKLGIWVVTPLLIISVTGFLFFLPFPPWQLALSSTLNFNPKNLLDRNPWKGKIQKAVYNPNTRKIVILTKDGLMEWDGNLQNPCKKIPLQLPERLMSGSVFRYVPEDKSYLVGSFSGLHKIDPTTGRVIDYPRTDGRSITRVCGYLRKPSGDEYYCHHEKGITPIASYRHAPEPIAMPEAASKTPRVSFWYFCFELHSGHVFKPLLGKNDWLLAFIGGLFLAFTGISGILNWYYRRKGKEGGRVEKGSGFP